MEQEKNKYLIELAKHPGWLVLRDEINKKIATKKDMLESCPAHELDGHRGELKSLRFVLNKVDEAIKTKGEKQDG